MKKYTRNAILTVGFVLFASVASESMAHSHTPYEYGGLTEAGVLARGAVTFNEVAFVPIQVSNINRDTVLNYKIYSDERVYKRIKLLPLTTTTLRVPVVMVNKNTPEIHKVCSVSSVGSNQKGAGISPRFCTTAKLYWSAD